MSEKPPAASAREVLKGLGWPYSDATILLHEAIARSAGLSGADHKYLGLLLRHGAMTAGEWGRLTGLSSGAITGLIDRLEGKGLLRRVPDPADRRKVVLQPDAAQAQQLLAPAFGPLQQATAQLISTLSEAEAAVIVRYLRAAIDLMQAHTERLNAGSASGS